MYTITPDDVPAVLGTCLLARQTPCLVGVPGVGKSMSVADWANRMKRPLSVTLWSCRDETTAEGLFVPDESHGTFLALPPPEFPREPGTIWFHDELDRAAPEVLNALTRLFLDRELSTYKVPDDTLLVGAMNGESDTFTTPVPEALRARLRFFYIVPSRTGWKAWAESNGVRSEIVEDTIDRWHEVQQEYTFKDLAEQKSQLRARALASSLLDALDVVATKRPEVRALTGAFLQSAVGYPSAVRLLARRFKHIPVQQILDTPGIAPIPQSPSEQLEIIAALVGCPKVLEAVEMSPPQRIKTSGNLAQYVTRMPREIARVGLTRLETLFPDILTTTAAISFLNRAAG